MKIRITEALKMVPLGQVEVGQPFWFSQKLYIRVFHDSGIGWNPRPGHLPALCLTDNRATEFSGGCETLVLPAGNSELVVERCHP